MSANEDGSNDFAAFGEFNFTVAAAGVIEDYVRRMKKMQKAGSFAVLVEWADDRRSRNIEGSSWIAHGSASACIQWSHSLRRRKPLTS